MAYPMVDETDNRHNKLVVLHRAPNSDNGKVQWLCQCDCGNLRTVIGTELRQNKMKSCSACAIKDGESKRIATRIMTRARKSEAREAAGLPPLHYRRSLDTEDVHQAV